MLVDPCSTAETFFKRSIEHAFGRHIRAISQQVRDSDRGFDAIELVMAPQLEPQYAQMRIREYVAHTTEIDEDGDGGKSATGEQHQEIRKTL